jgi:hypothetical protein
MLEKLIALPSAYKSMLLTINNIINRNTKDPRQIQLLDILAVLALALLPLAT